MQSVLEKARQGGNNVMTEQTDREKLLKLADMLEKCDGILTQHNTVTTNRPIYAQYPDNFRKEQAVLLRSVAEGMKEGWVSVPVAKCPHCDDEGSWVEPDIHTGEPCQIQCKFCDTTPNSLFNIKAMISSRPKTT